MSDFEEYDFDRNWDFDLHNYFDYINSDACEGEFSFEKRCSNRSKAGNEESYQVRMYVRIRCIILQILEPFHNVNYKRYPSLI